MRIFWFRRDLRLEDNHGLFQALSSNEEVLPIFIFDPTILDQLPKTDPRITFIHAQLKTINQQLNQFHQKNIAIFFGSPLTVFKQLIKNHAITSIYTNTDYEPYAIKRDSLIEQFLTTKDIDFLSFKDQVIFEKNEITKSDQTPYVVYTPYSKKWLDIYQSKKQQTYPSQDLLHQITEHSYPFLTLKEIGFEASKIEIPDYQLNELMLSNYEADRNFPEKEATSGLSTHLRFGTVSIRKIVSEASKSSNLTFLKELIWREFFMQILWHFPHTTTQSFRLKYDCIVWENNEDLFEKWCAGQTGYPIVDAGMRELNQTGLMHNRVRMIVASFLCKHLLIDWRWGEAYFAQKLLDYDQSSNVGNWQWACGSGVDAAPYFRIFNPTEQVKKFDKNLHYIKKWVPELDTFDYPAPVIDHKIARERCLLTYKKGLENI